MNANPDSLGLVPRPAQLLPQEGVFAFGAATQLVFDGGNPQTAVLAEAAAERIRRATGFPVTTSPTDRKQPAAGEILLTTASSDAPLGDEGYRLDVAPATVRLQAAQPAGIARGLQTLRQLLPVEIESAEPPADASFRWEAPCVRIEDHPRFSWCGVLWDSGRHFQPPDFIKRHIDLLALHKMNVFHWHLTEDQGWRIEIRKHPRLTEVGAWRGPNQARYGGFYTQQEIRDIVAYAAQRHVMVVPEIEMPGHAVAALAAYPELSCTGGPFGVETNWGVAKDVFCAGNDRVFDLLQDVLTEVFELFPSPWVHIGADECPKDRWQKCPKCQQRIRDNALRDEQHLQRWFIERVSRFVAQCGRRVIGWDEIMEGDPSPELVTVQGWRSQFHPVATAIEKGYRAIASEHLWNYFNYGLNIVDLRKAYSYDPLPVAASPDAAARLIGGECALWTEYIRHDMVEDKLYPRLLATADNLWAPAQGKDFDAFYRCIRKHCSRLRRLGVRYGGGFRCGEEPAAS